METNKTNEQLFKNEYMSPTNVKMNLWADKNYSDDEKEYLLNPNPYWDSFEPYEFFIPKLNEPFFCAMIDYSSTSCGVRNYQITIIPRYQRVTIISDGKVKKYSTEYITHSVADSPTKGKMFDEYHEIGDKKIVPDDNSTCNCGHYNNKPIAQFPWDKNPQNYVVASTFEKLQNNINILMKRLSVYDFIELVMNTIIERKKKIDGLNK